MQPETLNTDRNMDPTVNHEEVKLIDENKDLAKKVTKEVLKKEINKTA